MFTAKKLVLCIVMVAGLLLPCSTVNATVEVTTGFVSERKTTFISLHHEDTSPFAQLIAELAQSVNALDDSFHGLHIADQLLSSFPTLTIEISDDAYQRLLPAGAKAEGYVVLSLVNDYRLDLDHHDVITADAIALGPVYSIELALWPVSFDDLLTLVLLLPRLSVDNPRMELLATDIWRYRGAVAAGIRRSMGTFSRSDQLWSPDGNRLLQASWYNRRLRYQVFDFAAQERMYLDSLNYYILPPTFSPDSRYIVYASQTELKIVDLKQHRTNSFSLQKMAPGTYQFISLVQFASNNAGDTLLFSLFGWGMPTPLTFLWRNAQPEQTEAISGLEAFAKPDLPGETWSDWLYRRHPSVVQTPAEFIALKREMTTAADENLRTVRDQLRVKYGTFYGLSVNYPQNDRLAVLVEYRDRFGARVLGLPFLTEVYSFRFKRVPELRNIIPGQVAGISLFNVAVISIILLIAAAVTWLAMLIKQKFASRTTAPISRKITFIFFTGALLITLLLHFMSTIYLTVTIGGSMGDRANDIVRQATTTRYAKLGYTVGLRGDTEMVVLWGNSPFWYIDVPYQVLYWRLSGFTLFAAPVPAGFAYAVYNQHGHFVELREAYYYVLGVNRLIRKY